LVFILIVLCLYLFAAPVKLAKHERRRSSAGRRPGGHDGNVGDACGTHLDFSFTSFSFFPMAGSVFLNNRPGDQTPELAILLHPLGSLPQRFGIDPHFVNASIAPTSKQPGLLQHAQVFRDRWERHGVRFRQMRHTFIAPRQMSQDAPAGGISQRGERAIQSPGRIFNHLVK